ncbi:MAG: flagellar motor switch protein FliN [Cellulomonadaceae bacterium]|nr:flagellar motor switch protein FliN [Cellulomonadaceae bacterium]
MNSQPSSSPASTALGEDARAVAAAAAGELARLLPSTVPLTVVAFDPATAPADDAVAVMVTFVGAVSAELTVVADEAVAEAVAGAGGITLAEALRPSLEAASATLGAGVLDTAHAGPVGDRLVDDGVIAFALADGTTGAPQAWFGMRLRPSPGVPQQRTVTPATFVRTDMRLLHDVEMTLTAEIGRTKLPVRQVLDLVPGTVLELDRAAGAPADVMVNGRLVARGEVVVVDEDYGIRITEIVATETA